MHYSLKNKWNFHLRYKAERIDRKRNHWNDLSLIDPYVVLDFEDEIFQARDHF